MVDLKVSGSLVGRRILVTRSREQASTLSRLLAERGAVPVELPTIEFLPPADSSPIELAIGRIADYDWVVFTSANGVGFFVELLRARTLDPKLVLKMRIAAIGPATAEAVSTLGLDVDLVPSTFVAEAVVEEFSRFDLRGKRVLVPQALEARDVLAEGLLRQGAIVDAVPVYQTVRARDQSSAREFVARGDLSAITLTSSSTARNLVTLVGDAHLGLLRAATIATIGPITSQTARELGLTVEIEASQHTIPGLVAALERYFEG